MDFTDKNHGQEIAHNIRGIREIRGSLHIANELRIVLECQLLPIDDPVSSRTSLQSVRCGLPTRLISPIRGCKLACEEIAFLLLLDLPLWKRPPNPKTNSPNS